MESAVFLGTLQLLLGNFEGQLELLTFAHNFRSCNQDSSAVVAVMEDVICQLEVVMPNLTRVFYRQDNAGCYHCGATIDCASNSGSRNGVQVERLDFSDAQGGKGACDRKAATIKAHMHVFLNAGHDIDSAEQMYDAMTSDGGVPSLSVTLCESVSIQSSVNCKIEGVSLISNIKYSSEGIRVWRAFNIDPGRLIRPQRVPVSLPQLPSLLVLKGSSFSAIKGRVSSYS